MMLAKRTRIRVLLSALTVLACIAAAVASGFGFVFNTEDCMPMGWYVTAPVLTPIRRGDVVLVCPPVDNPEVAFAVRRGWIKPENPSPCADGLTPYVKQVYAVQGDRVDLTKEHVAVNGVRLPDSASLATTADGHTPMPHVPFGNFTVMKNQVLLLGLHASNAFDGRYFGPLDQSTVVRRLFKI